MWLARCCDPAPLGEEAIELKSRAAARPPSSGPAPINYLVTARTGYTACGPLACAVRPSSRKALATPIVEVNLHCNHAGIRIPIALLRLDRPLSHSIDDDDAVLVRHTKINAAETFGRVEYFAVDPWQIRPADAEFRRALHAGEAEESVGHARPDMPVATARQCPLFHHKAIVQADRGTALNQCPILSLLAVNSADAGTTSP